MFPWERVQKIGDKYCLRDYLCDFSQDMAVFLILYFWEDHKEESLGSA